MWNKFRFSFSSLFRRFQLLLGSLAVILLVVFLPLSASADTIHLNLTYGNTIKNSLVTAPVSGDNPVNRLESQYTYGGIYNPLILADSQSLQWSFFKAGVYWSFGQSLSAGTVLSISCGGWFNHGYSISGTPVMHASVYNPWVESQDWKGSKQFLEPQFSSVDEYVQTSNGVYHGLLYQGTYTLPAQSDGIWLTFVGNVMQRTGGCYIGISCSDISYQGTPVSPAESDIYGTPESGSFDDTSTAIGNVESAESALISGGDSAISGALCFLLVFLQLLLKILVLY